MPRIYVPFRLRDYSGRPIAQSTDPTSPPATLAFCLIHAALNAQVSPGDKFRVYQLVERIHKAAQGDGLIDLPAEDVALLKGFVNTVYPTGLVGPITLALESDAVAKPAPVRDAKEAIPDIRAAKVADPRFSERPLDDQHG
jgi:hypothetical protein